MLLCNCLTVFYIKAKIWCIHITHNIHCAIVCGFWRPVMVSTWCDVGVKYICDSLPTSYSMLVDTKQYTIRALITCANNIRLNSLFISFSRIHTCRYLYSIGITIPAAYTSYMDGFISCWIRMFIPSSFTRFKENIEKTTYFLMSFHISIS